MKFFIFIPRILVKPIMWLLHILNIPDYRCVLVCYGYCENYEIYTAVYWDEDHGIKVKDYDDFQLWIYL